MIKVEKSKVTMQGKGDDILAELCMATYRLVNEIHKTSKKSKIDILTDLIVEMTLGVGQCIKEEDK